MLIRYYISKNNSIYYENQKGDKINDNKLC